MLTLIEGPGTTFLDQGLVLQHLRLEEDTPDLPIIQEYIAAAQAYLDGPNGVLGRALITQTWALSLDCFSPILTLPLPPHHQVLSVSYLAENLSSQEVDSARYMLSPGSQGSRLLPVHGQSWPSTDSYVDSVTVRFVTGYGPAPADIPAPIRQAGYLIVSDLYENPSQQVEKELYQNQAVEALLTPYKVPHIGIE